MNQDPVQWMPMKVTAEPPPSAVRNSSLSAADRDIWALKCLSGRRSFGESHCASHTLHVTFNVDVYNRLAL
jgi:hypothetical protein